MTTNPHPTEESVPTVQPKGETEHTPTDDTTQDPRLAYRRFARHATFTLAALAVLGFLPTRRLAGDPGLVAMGAAFASALAASIAGTLPVWRSRFQHPSHSVPVALGAMAIRLLVVLVLGVAIALTGLVPLAAYLIWLAVSHSSLLIADTAFAKSITAYAMKFSTQQSQPSQRPKASTESR